MQDRFMFRAWDNTYKQFIFRTLFEAKETILSWEQCTGLKDKNGRLIYEGDIVKTDNGNIYYIKWDEKTGSFREEDYNCKNAIYGAGHHLSLWKDSYCKSYEIVGNIHTNPKLMEA